MFFHWEETLCGKTYHSIDAVPKWQVAILHSRVCGMLQCLGILMAVWPHDEQLLGYSGKCQGVGELRRGRQQICREISAPWFGQKKLRIKQCVSFLSISPETIKITDL